MRFSDDGEPQGTAGMPILGVLRARKLYECAVAVVRYFGGVKLGAGGLTRAYSSCAAECLDGARLALWDVCIEYCVRADYPEINALTRFFEGRCEILSREFAEKASFVVAVREGSGAQFCAALTDQLCGKAEICEQRRYFAPFPLDK